MRESLILSMFCVLPLGLFAESQPNAVRVEQGTSKKFYLLNSGVNASFTEQATLTINGKVYDLSSGPVLTTFDAVETYTRENLSAGKWGTICLGYEVANLEDANTTFYKLNYYDGGANLYADEVPALEAGHPYLFEAQGESFTLILTPGEEAEAQTVNGLIGTLEDYNMTENAYALVNNMVVKAAAGTTVPANRAYIDLDQVSRTPQTTPASAPRRIGVANTPTELESVDAGQCTMHDGKYIKDGHLVIIHNGKAYNAVGVNIQ